MIISQLNAFNFFELFSSNLENTEKKICKRNLCVCLKMNHFRYYISHRLNFFQESLKTVLHTIGLYIFLRNCFVFIFLKYFKKMGW